MDIRTPIAADKCNFNCVPIVKHLEFGFNSVYIVDTQMFNPPNYWNRYFFIKYANLLLCKTSKITLLIFKITDSVSNLR